MTLTAEFDTEINNLLGGRIPRQLTICASGGGDSTALLYLAADWAKRAKCKLNAVTVDHGLRAAAKKEADAVSHQCADLEIPHETLFWEDWNGAGNMQDQARQARYRLVGQWARAQNIKHVLLGHTLDDQAETVLMRMARGSGVDGLSAMAPIRASDGICWLRPMLKLRRNELRTLLADSEINWIEDPSNDDQKYDRVKVRIALDALEELGVTRQGLAATAERIRSARQVLSEFASRVAREIVEIRAGSVSVATAGFFDLPAETRRRLLAHCLCWVAREKYPPRHTSLMALETSIRAGRTSTLQGCLIDVSKNNFEVGREPAAVTDLVSDPAEIWDKRWKLTGPAAAGQLIRITGEIGLSKCPEWRASGLRRSTLMAAPAVWLNDELIAAPLAGFANGWRAEMIHDENHFYSTLLSH